MSDTRSTYDEQLPWLEAVDDEDGPSGVSARKMLAALAVVLLAAAIVAGGFFWLGRRDAARTGPPQLIQAEAGPYKVKPANPGGLDVAGESETAFKTSAGEDTDAELDASKLPVPSVAQAPAKPPAAEPKAAPSPEPAPATGGKGSVVQLGAFGNRAQAERAWAALSARFPSVAASSKMVIPFPGGIRLRAGTESPAAARELCSALKAAGENCFIAN